MVIRECKEIIDPDCVLFLEETRSEDCIRKMIDRLVSVKNISSPEEFYRAVLEREKIASTGIGLGIAMPHAKLPVYDDFFMALGILQKGIPWNAPDDIPVRLIFLIGGPDDRQTEYLRLLSRLTSALRDEEKRKKLLTLTIPERMIPLFQSVS